MTRKGQFDAEAFYSTLDAERQARKLTWKQVASGSGVSASTLTRMAQGRRPDVDSLSALASWSGINVDEFVRPKGGKEEAEPLAMISTHLRTDKNLSPEAANALEQIIKAAYEHLREEA